MDINSFQEIRESMPTLNEDQLRYYLYEVNTWWTEVDYSKIRDFGYDQEDEAIGEIVKVLKLLKRGWKEKDCYEEAAVYLDEAKRANRCRNPKQLRSYLAQDLGYVQRQLYMKIVARNDTPKKRRGRKRKVQLAFIEGNWDGSHHGDLPWRAEDLIKEGA